MGNAPSKYYKLENRQSENKKYYDELIIKSNLTDDQVDYFDSIGFSMLPASLTHHSNFEGGLVYHSYIMAKILEHLSKGVLTKHPDIEFNPWKVALCHDVCKSIGYKKLEDGTWSYNSQNPYSGHGAASLMMCQASPHFITFSTEEALSIVWHMGAYNLENSELEKLRIAKKQSNGLVLLTHTADDFASSVQEKTYKVQVNKVWED